MKKKSICKNCDRFEDGTCTLSGTNKEAHETCSYCTQIEENVKADQAADRYWRWMNT